MAGNRIAYPCMLLLLLWKFSVMLALFAIYKNMIWCLNLSVGVAAFIVSRLHDEVCCYYISNVSFLIPTPSTFIEVKFGACHTEQ